MGRYQLSRNTRVFSVREFYIFKNYAINSKIPAGLPHSPLSMHDWKKQKSFISISENISANKT